jgi:chromosome segregation ATPase
MFNKNKFPKVGALREASEITAEMVQEANDELQAAGINAFIVATSEDYPNLEAIETAISEGETATSELATVNSRVEELEGTVTSLTEERDNLQTERDDLTTQVEELGGKAGSGKPSGKKSEKTGGETSFEENEYYSEADKMLDAELANDPLRN